MENAKNAEKLNKKRRTFNCLVIFGYNHGNVVCQVLYKNDISRLKKIYERPITLPIFFTKYLARSFKEILKPYLRLYF